MTIALLFAARVSAAPRCTPGPPVRPISRAPAFHVFADCVDKEGRWLAIAAALEDTTPPTRTAMEFLLRALDAQVKHTMGRTFPPKVELCVYPAGTSSWSAELLGCIKRGFENEETEGGAAGEDDDEPQIENRAPFTPAEEVHRIAGLLGGELGKGRRASVGEDAAHRTMKVVYPLGGARPTFVDAAVAFFSVATRVYPPPTSLVALDFVGTWHDEVRLRVHVADERMFTAMGVWPMRERLSHAGIALDPRRPRTSAQTAQLEAELRAALAKLPADAVQLAAP